MKTVYLQSSDDEVFKVDIDVAMCSGTLKTLLKDFFGVSEVYNECIPLPNVNSKILQLVIEYCTYHKDDPVASDDEDGEKRTDDLEDWDEEFIEVDVPTIFGILSAANYLHIRPLLNLCAKAIARMLKGRTAEEIRQTFNIANDLTPEEEAIIRNENGFCQEFRESAFDEEPKSLF